MDILHKIQADLQGKNITPEKFSDRIIFMSMFNDIELEGKDNEDSCALTSRNIKEYASTFNEGHWAFLEPREESKWYQGYAADYGGKWDLRASQMVEDFENSGHRVFHGISPLGRGILEKKNNRDTIHFNGEFDNIDLLYSSCREPALCLWGSLKVVWTEIPRSKPKQTRKCSQDVTRNSHKTGRCQVIG